MEIALKDPKTKFLLNYGQTGNRVEAANRSGITATEVEEYLNPASDKFDASFAAAMQEEHIRRLWDIEDAAIRQAQQGHANLAKFFLQHLDERFSKTPDRDSKTLNLFWFEDSDKERTKALEVLDSVFPAE